ncbi:MAG TPA: hypothetical protein VGH28_02400 [Polyangiaceae bacterium]
MRRALSLFIGSVVVVACSRDGGGNEPIATTAGLDVRGQSNTPCTLTIDGDGTSTFEIAAPSPAVSDAPPVSTPAALTTCSLADASAVAVTGSPTCVRATRTSTQLCFFQDGCLGSPSTSQRDCPVTLTLTCNGVKVYDHVPWKVCAWFG